MQARVRDLPSAFHGMQQEYLELTSRLSRPPAILAEAHWRLTTSLELPKSALFIMYEALYRRPMLPPGVPVAHPSSSHGRAIIKRVELPWGGGVTGTADTFKTSKDRLLMRTP